MGFGTKNVYFKKSAFSVLFSTNPQQYCVMKNFSPKNPQLALILAFF